MKDFKNQEPLIALRRLNWSQDKGKIYVEEIKQKPHNTVFINNTLNLYIFPKVIMWFCIISVVHMVTESLERIVLFCFDIFSCSKAHITLWITQTQLTIVIIGKVELAPLDFLILYILGGANSSVKVVIGNNASNLQENTGRGWPNVLE